LERSKEPACVALCPTNALGIRQRIPQKTNDEDIPGFRDYSIKPGISITNLNPDRQQPEMNPSEYVSNDMLDLLRNQLMKKLQKMNIKKEWILLLLSVIFPFLIASAAVVTWTSSDEPLIPIIIISGIISLGLSTFHLGNKIKAYRAVLNIKSSWLSREVIFLFLFLFTLTAQYFLFEDIIFLRLAAVLFGIYALFSMDKIYTVIPKVKPENINSTPVVLSGLYWYGILSINLYILGLIGSLRIYLYLNKEHNNILIPVIRLISTYFIPILILITGYTYFLPLIMLCVLIGEIIERYEFYKSIDIITPLRQMQIDEELNLNSLTLQKIKEII